MICENFIQIIYHLLVQRLNIDGLVQDCSISIANALDKGQSSTKPSI